MKRIYLSGPMTGLPGLNFAAFHAMTTNLRAGGHTVTNPAEINPDGGTWNDCMRRDIAALMDWDTVAIRCGQALLQFVDLQLLGIPGQAGVFAFFRIYMSSVRTLRVVVVAGVGDLLAAGTLEAWAAACPFISFDFLI